MARFTTASSRRCRRRSGRKCCAFVTQSSFHPTHIIYRAGEAVEHAYFINSGLVSLIKGMADGRTTVIGAVGAEGLVGVFAAAGFERALADYIVEVPAGGFSRPP